jgi:hypothetical protein
VTLGGFAVLYVLLLSRLRLPEERIHYLEYGLLAGFLYCALLERHNRLFSRPGTRLGSRVIRALGPILGALCLNALFGWLDEGIQALLPDRHYDLRDVMMNALAGTIAIAGIVALRQARRLDQRS